MKNIQSVKFKNGTVTLLCDECFIYIIGNPSNNWSIIKEINFSSMNLFGERVHDILTRYNGNYLELFINYKYYYNFKCASKSSIVFNLDKPITDSGNIGMFTTTVLDVKLVDGTPDIYQVNPSVKGGNELLFKIWNFGTNDSNSSLYRNTCTDLNEKIWNIKGKFYFVNDISCELKTLDGLLQYLVFTIRTDDNQQIILGVETYSGIKPGFKIDLMKGYNDKGKLMPLYYQTKESNNDNNDIKTTILLEHDEIIKEHIKEFSLAITSYIEKCENPVLIKSHYDTFKKAIKTTEILLKPIQKEIIDNIHSKCIDYLTNHQFQQYHNWFKILDYFMNK